MNTELIIMNFSGQHDLNKLARLNFTHKNGGWIFEGVMHRYVVIEAKTMDGCIITIRPKSDRERPIPGEITLGNMNDWVKSILDTISGQSNG